MAFAGVIIVLDKFGIDNGIGAYDSLTAMGAGNASFRQIKMAVWAVHNTSCAVSFIVISVRHKNLAFCQMRMHRGLKAGIFVASGFGWFILLTNNGCTGIDPCAGLLRRCLVSPGRIN